MNEKQPKSSAVSTKKKKTKKKQDFIHLALHCQSFPDQYTSIEPAPAVLDLSIPEVGHFDPEKIASFGCFQSVASWSVTPIILQAHGRWHDFRALSSIKPNEGRSPDIDDGQLQV